MKYDFFGINDLFSAIAPSYDRMNDIMSLGMHHIWKSVFVNRLMLYHKETPTIYLDMACGTGDIGGLVLEKALQKNIRIDPIFVDPNPDLLAIAQNRYRAHPIVWMQEVAETISVAENSVDIYTISFGLRNVQNRTQALKRAWEILAPGGQFWCLEFSHPENPLMRDAFYQYLKVLPFLGQHFIQQKTPYAYLSESIRQFPTCDVLLQELEHAGFKNLTCEPLFHGVVAITRGTK